MRMVSEVREKPRVRGVLEAKQRQYFRNRKGSSVFDVPDNEVW